MNITTRELGGVTILEPAGKITIGEGDVAFREAMAELIEAGARKVLVDLQSTSRIDSSGLGELVAAYTSITGLGGDLKLLNAQTQVREVLGITQIVNVVDVFDNESAALASFH